MKMQFKTYSRRPIIWLYRYDTIRYTIFTCAEKLTNSQLNLPHGTTQKVTKKLKTKSEMLRRNGPVLKSVELVLRPEGSHGGKDL